MLKTYYQDITWLESLANLPNTNYLSDIKKYSASNQRLKNFLQLLGNPQDKLNFINITGTSGKGTTVKLLESLLTDAGSQVGAYISPFTTTSIEKISINKKLISHQALHQILEKKIKPAFSQYSRTFDSEPISYFETWLAIALIYFQEAKCDWVILEAGLGWTNDATNIVSRPRIVAITNVGLDHMEILGQTKNTIAKNKASFIKKDCIFITTETDTKLKKIFANVCQKKQAWFMSPKNLVKDYKTENNYWQTKRQKANLNLVLNILDILGVKAPHTQKIINQFQLICRQEIIHCKPLVILDGSHNSDKLNNLIDFVKKQKYRRLHLVIGFSHNKNYLPPLKKLLAITDYLYLTRFTIPNRKTADLRKLYLNSRRVSCIPINIYYDPHQAIDTALKSAHKNDLILVTGSFFLSGELRKKWVSEEKLLKIRKI